GNVLLIDPWLTNPIFEKGEGELADLKRVDLILLTHGHGDHVGNAVEIGKRTGAKLVSTYDLAEAMKLALGYPAKQADNDPTGAFGGQLSLLDGDATVCFVPAWHGSGVVKDEMSPPIYAGTPADSSSPFATVQPFITPATQHSFPTSRASPIITRSISCWYASAIISPWDQSAQR